jgi:hypothetical protein
MVSYIYLFSSLLDTIGRPCGGSETVPRRRTVEVVDYLKYSRQSMGLTSQGPMPLSPGFSFNQ